MKMWTKIAVVTVISTFVAEATVAQGQRGERGGRGGGFGGRGGFGGGSPIMAALDADQDGTLSASEIANASAALKALDKDGDGKLSGEEIRPARGEGRGRGGRGGGFGGPGGGPGGPGGEAGNYSERLMAFDENKDGKLTKAELPERMARIVEQGDKDGDGAVDAKESEAMMANFRGGFGRPGGNRGGEGGQRSGRPQRPTRPQ